MAWLAAARVSGAGPASTAGRPARRLREDEVGAAADLLVRAFADAPFTVLLSPDPARRPAVARWAFTGHLRYGRLFGEVWAVGEPGDGGVAGGGVPAGDRAGQLDGVAIWWAPPRVYPDAARAALVGLDRGSALLGPGVWERYLGFAELADELHRRSLPEPHWYLTVLGVEPARQGQGVGGRLLGAMFDRLDRDGLPAYLDTTSAENVAYYQRRGFVLVAEEADPSSGIVIRGLRRDPRPLVR